MTMERSWKIQDIGKGLKSTGLAILKGEFLLRLNVGKYFIHIIYAFFLIAMAIWISLLIEGTLAKVEKNNRIISELEIINEQKYFDLEAVSSRTSVGEMLKERGSKVGAPVKPATLLVQ